MDDWECWCFVCCQNCREEKLVREVVIIVEGHIGLLYRTPYLLLQLQRINI